MSEPVFLPAGDTALVVQFGEAVDAAVNRRVRHLALKLRESEQKGIVDIVPTIRSLMVHYDPLVTGAATLEAAISEMLHHEDAGEDAYRLWSIPVCYEGDCAPDLDNVAREMELDTAEVVRRHAAEPLEIFMMGFLPGFPYLGLLPEEFDIPRLFEPRVKVPARSISIAVRQTTIYTVECPGGWHLIGRTPVEFFDPFRAQPILVAAGDRIRFEPVAAGEYQSLRKAVEAGDYEAVSEEVAP
ncbi:5-oxoprolinase subunit PxpB [Nisaea acidiphila]|uniref:5-oxoprolinase subunit PxpB n=1 Tax=Nisaea acidiphila TaxID=1862145 RepID=A0A9J7ARK9_9PROT|nr:5-oxoprolinase subunit PxpB [Nisaea acidiphila]UUX50000.1 5-oxoprolinase subunit PxpB [Nisaea acidiphila]